AACNGEESQVVECRAASSPFGDVGRNARGGATHLACESETFELGKRGCYLINSDHHPHGVLPDVQSFMRSLLRIPNLQSRIPALQPITNCGSSNSTGWPLSARMAMTVPDTSASIWLNIFIASMMPRVSPGLTFWPIVTNGGASGFAD